MKTYNETLLNYAERMRQEYYDGGDPSPYRYSSVISFIFGIEEHLVATQLRDVYTRTLSEV